MFNYCFQRFQEIEEGHLKQMKEFISSYLDIVNNNFESVGQVTKNCIKFLYKNHTEYPSLTQKINLNFLSNTILYSLLQQVHLDFKRQFLELTVDKLLEQFVLNKYTGLEKPGKCSL